MVLEQKYTELDNKLVNISKCNQFIVITFLNDIDAFVVSEVKNNIKQIVKNDNGQRNVMIDLAKIEFIDSYAVGLFVSLLKILHKNNKKLIFAGASGQPQSILNIVGLNEDVVSFIDNI